MIDFEFRVIANYFLTKGAVEFFVSNPFIRILETVDTTRAIISRSDLAVSYGLGFFAALVVGTLSGMFNISLLSPVSPSFL